MKILRDPLFLMVACVLLGWGVYRGTQPPEPRGVMAPESVFSAGRAFGILEELYPDNEPHVSGSQRNARMRDRIVAIFKRFGYAAQVQKRFHCNPAFGLCSPLENIVAVRQGVNAGHAILITAHYDSTWSGPGVGDDGAAVAAILEIARLCNEQPQFANDVIFLITDAEEQGLIGADAFAAHNELFAGVRAVINLEARGVSGASVMFETGENNRGIVRMLAKNLDHPVANSLAYEVYRRMPNDTDFSIYRSKGLTGVNFAFTGGAALYHSSLDDLGHLDRGSLQHHGDNAWSMLLALDERVLDKLASTEDAAYIDLFGQRLLHYPVTSALGLALVLSVLTLVAVRRAFYRQVRFRQVIWTVVGIVLLASGLFAAGWVLSWPLGRWVDSHPLQHPFPWLGRAVLLLAALVIVSRTLQFLSARASAGSVMAACWGIYALLAMALALYFPAASYVAVLPLLGFTLGLVLDGFRWKELPHLLFASLFGFLAALYIGLYFFFQLDIVLNFSYSQFKIMPLLLPLLALLPILADYYSGRETGYGFTLVLGGVVLVGCAAQMYIPAYNLDTPRGMSLMYRQDAGRDSAWLVLDNSLGRPDADFAQNHGFTPQNLPVVYGGEREALALTTELLALPEVAVGPWTETEGETPGLRAFTLELDIPEEARQLGLDFPPGAGLKRARIDGRLAFDRELASNGKNSRPGVRINHPPPGRARFEFEFDGAGPFEVTLTTRYDLPANVFEPYAEDWPGNAHPAFQGPRALKSMIVTFGD